MGQYVLISVIVFTVVILLLVSLLLYVKAKVSSGGKIKITINDGARVLEVDAGSTLMSTLSTQGVYLPSACGGGGTCLQCVCQVSKGGGNILPTEEPNFSRKQIAQHYRLGCQVKVKEDMEIHIHEEILGIKEWEAVVSSNYNMATFIKEFIVELPEDMDYKAGGYIQIKIPAGEVKYSDMDITAHPVDHEGQPDKFKADWDKFGLWPLVMTNNEEVIRAYSMASYPAEGRKIMLNVRIATPPWDRAKNAWMNVNPGVASSYIFNLKQGDKAMVSGPYGEFFINPSESEMLYIGGGAGMAPMRSHLYELFKTLRTNRKVTYWYGGRSKAELFYIEHFRSLEREFPNFKFYLVLSEPLPADNWTVMKDVNDIGDGFVGFVHKVVIEQYLQKHDAPEDLEVYFCGPPLMNQAVITMCDEWGVPPENVRFDDFGG